ncbi:MAG: filamentation induced by cAMP protein Fic [Candidatus Saganbacteria bacterium]|uniref:Filamentation induced by cAMP protein Fic n=1 Tax=Candidatus Saganbacteria bacterium TaxID=2575572 RepID=A0A833L331_UNCSA|nr:MAG: filamentation induced by cAMP protein Fic [Candidatus Saganbacteria bacterium]
MEYLKKEVISRIEQKLKILNRLRPLPAAQVRKLKEQFQIEMTYNSNGIEGNSLTMKETFLVINEGITIKGKPLKDHLEAKDHYAALQYLYELVEKDKKHTISELLIRHLHQLVVMDTDREWAGKYRDGNVIIGGAKHAPPEAIEIHGKMHDLIVWFKQNINKLHPIELAAIFHHKLVFVHPFFDGNGRTARLAMNLLLMGKGYPLAVISKNDRKKYYRVLAEADKNNFVPLVRFLAQAVERSLDIYLKVLKTKNVKAGSELSLSQLAKKTRFSAKYLNLLARQGKLDAYKKGRNWITTEKALKDYLEKRLRKR